MEKYSCETDFIELKGELIWRIRHFTKIQELYRKDEFLESQRFQLAGCDRTFHFILYPNGKTYFCERITVSLLVTDEIPTCREIFRCKISLIDKTGKRTYKSTMPDYGFCQYIGPENGVFSVKQRENLLPDDALTLCCLVKLTKITVSNTGAIQIQNGSLIDDGATVSQYKNNSDVVLRVGNRRIQASKALMASQSPVFCSMFKRRNQGNNTNEITIEDIEFDVLRRLVRFMYTGYISFGGVHFALEVLAAAYKYEVSSLLSHCTAYLISTVSTKSVFDILIASKAYHLHDLTDACMSVIKSEASAQPYLTVWISKLNSHPSLHEMIGEFLNP